MFLTIFSEKIKSLKFRLNSNIITKSPISYSETIYILSRCLFCFTDSGGLQEEAVILNKRCLIPSNKTPHSHYIHKFANHLLQINKENYLKQVNNFKKSILNNKIKKFYHQQNTTAEITKILNKNI